jgi:hypothetical protein
MRGNSKSSSDQDHRVPPIGLRWGRSRKLRDGIVKRQDHPGPEGRVDAEKLSSTAAWDGPITEAVVPE